MYIQMWETGAYTVSLFGPSVSSGFSVYKHSSVIVLSLVFECLHNKPIERRKTLVGLA